MTNTRVFFKELFQLNYSLEVFVARRESCFHVMLKRHVGGEILVVGKLLGTSSL